MSTRLCTINLSVKDYYTHEYGAFEYTGEVVVINEDLKQYDFRFYNTDSGTLAISIDFSKKVMKVIEHSENINLVMGLELDNYHPCVYHLDATNRLELITRTWKVEIGEGYICLDYDLYDSKDVEHNHPLTRNVVSIEYEGEGKIC